MSDEVQMPDPKVEASDILFSFDSEQGEMWVRSLMARTLRAAAARIDALEFDSSQFVELERMASEIEHGE